MVQRQTTNLYVLLDMTGSMMSRKQMALDALNEYLDAVKQSEEDGSDMLVSLGVFNSGIGLEKIFSGQPIGTIHPISQEQYKPSSGTPLYDAVGQAIEDLDGKQGPKLLVIQTDGEENDSRRFKKQDIIRMIGDRTQDGWQFLYLGCDLDAMQQAAGIGIGRDQTLSYDNGSTRQAYDKLSQQTIAYRASGGQIRANLGGEDLRRNSRRTRK